jgi:pyruvate/2-oxoglutarate dehydrogenase complex dihydrolipoamide dehydrogenase (E3) component
MPPHKDLLSANIHYYETRLAELDVELHVGEDVTEQSLEEKGLDFIILATGSRPALPPIPGADQPNVATARDVLLDLCPVGETPLVVGGGLVGSETAEFLAERGKTVKLIEMLEELALDVEPRSRLLLLERLERLGVETMTGCKLVSIIQTGAIVEQNGEQLTLETDSVVLAVGSEPNNELERKLRKGGRHVIAVGDCTAPGNIKEAVHQGCWLVYEELGK